MVSPVLTGRAIEMVKINEEARWILYHILEKNGEFPMAALGVTLSAYKAFDKALCQFL